MKGPQDKTTGIDRERFWKDYYLLVIHRIPLWCICTCFSYCILIIHQLALMDNTMFHSEWEIHWFGKPQKRKPERFSRSQENRRWYHDMRRFPFRIQPTYYYSEQSSSLLLFQSRGVRKGKGLGRTFRNVESWGNIQENMDVRRKDIGLGKSEEREVFLFDIQTSPELNSTPKHKAVFPWY